MIILNSMRRPSFVILTCYEIIQIIRLRQKFVKISTEILHKYSKCDNDPSFHFGALWQMHRVAMQLYEYINMFSMF